MAIVGFNESSLATSEIFSGLKDATGSDQRQKAINIIKTSRTLTKEDIEGVYVTLKQSSNSLVRAALKAFEEEKIVLKYNTERSLSVTIALPFITFNMGPDRYTTYVFMDNYVSERGKDQIMNVSAPVLQDLLIGSLISNGLKSNYDRLASNPRLERLLMDIYTRFFTHILNKDYSIRADKIAFDLIQYWVNRFFLLKVYGSRNTDDNIEILSFVNARYIDEVRKDEAKRLYDEANPDNLSDILELLKNASPKKMGALNKGSFISSWINFYYPVTMLAIDTIEYLIFMIIAVRNSSGMVSMGARDMVMETKNIKILYEELLKIIE